MAKRDFYETLGVGREADDGEIKRAFRKLAMQHHPDRNQGDKNAEQKFKEVNEAYDILKDQEKRAAYDRFGHAAFEQAGAGGAGARPGGFDFAGGFADIFDEMFGEFTGARRGQSSTRGGDVRYNLQISLEEAYTGKTTKIRVPSTVLCDACSGTGAEGGSQPVVCPTCQGHGKVRAQQGFFTIERTCPTCHGAGRVIETPCKKCGGSGRLKKEKTLSVNVPAGVEEGTRIRLSGEGEAGVRGGPPGDLYIFLSIRPHRIFKRDGSNLHVEVPIPMVTAAMGGNIEVPTIDGGRARVNVPEGTQAGHQFRLRNKGMSVLRSNAHGDLYLHAMVETPVNLTKKQRELLKEFDKAAHERRSNSPESEGFFARVKELWDDLTD